MNTAPVLSKRRPGDAEVFSTTTRSGAKSAWWWITWETSRSNRFMNDAMVYEAGVIVSPSVNEPGPWPDALIQGG